MTKCKCIIHFDNGEVLELPNCTVDVFDFKNADYFTIGYGAYNYVINSSKVSYICTIDVEDFTVEDILRS